MPEEALPILLYHKVGLPPRGCRLPGHYVSPGLFRKQMAFLSAQGYQAISLSRLGAALSGEGEGALLLTFDDGYRCLSEQAAPVLGELGFSAVIFLVADYLGKAASWEKRGPFEPLLSREEVLELARQGFEFGSHGCGHQRLTRLSDQELRREVSDSRSRIEDLLGRPCRAFAYPYGDCDARVTAAVAAAGYEFAFTTRRAWSRRNDPPLLLPRINIRRYNYLPIFARKLRRARKA